MRQQMSSISLSSGDAEPSVRDVGIDSLGVLIATILLDVGQKLVKLLKGRRHT